MMKKTQAYLRQNKKLSRLDTRIYYFLKSLYEYFISPRIDKKETKGLYEKYINLINFSFGLNGEEPREDLLEEIFSRMVYLLEREYSGPRTFILLNNHRHYELLRKAINDLQDLSAPEYSGYAEYDEFVTKINIIKGII